MLWFEAYLVLHVLQFDSSNCPPLLNPTRQIHEMQSFSLLPIIPKISEHNFQFLLLHKYVPKGLYVYVFFGGVVSTGVRVVAFSASTKSNPGVTWSTVVFIVPKNADSCFGAVCPGALDVEPFFVTVVIKGGTRGNQWKPRATTQWSRTVFSISDQWMQGTGALVDLNKIDLVVDLHTEANFGERCVPVGGKFGLLRVKPSLSAVTVKGFFALPKWRIVVKIFLLKEYY